MGTSVRSGSARVLIIETGSATAFGQIADHLVLRPPETEFERGTRQFGYFIMETVFVLVMFVVIVSVAFRKDAFESLLFAVALAVGLTPEFLPMITTVTLGEGALRMAKQKVIVKNLAAIQNFGSMDVLCSDKTGTLTSGEMSVIGVHPLGALDREQSVALAAALEQASEHPIGAALRAAAGRLLPAVDAPQSEPGRGVGGVVDGRRVRLGRPDYVAALHGRPLPESLASLVASGDTVVALADETPT